MLERGCPSTRVINAGVSGYTSFETLANVQFRVLDLEPDLIIVYHAVNDLLTRLVWPPEDFRGDISAYRGSIDQVVMPSVLEYSAPLRILLIELGQVQSDLERMFGGRTQNLEGLTGHSPAGPTVAEMLAANSPRFFTRNLGNLAAVARRNHSQVLCMSFAYCTQLEGQNEAQRELFARGIPELNAALEQLALAEGIAWFDLAAQFPDDPALFHDAVHMNPEGCGRQAALLADFLMDQQLVPKDL